MHKNKNVLILLLCILGFSLGIAEEPLAVYLTWQKDPTRTMTIQWITSKDSSLDTVEFQLVGDNEYNKKWKNKEGKHHSLPQEEPYFVHVVELEDLEPNSTYNFRIAGSKKENLFRTMPKDLSKPIVFLAGGDTNHSGTEMFEETNREACKHEPFFVLFGGDLAYAAPRLKTSKENSRTWLEWIASYSSSMITSKGYKIPLIVTLGNHDVKGHYDGNHEDAPFFYSLFAMPGLPGYNVLRSGSYLSIYLLDSNHTNRIKGPQTKWLNQELSKEKNTHRFAIYHVPAYPSVRNIKAYESTSIRRHWVPLFEKYGLAVAFENNDHAYKRTYPLRDGNVHPQGVVYIGDGSWGTKPRVPKKAKETNYLAKTKSARQFVKVELSQNMRQFWSITPDGEVIDHYIQFVNNPQEKLLWKEPFTPKKLFPYFSETALLPKRKLLGQR